MTSPQLRDRWDAFRDEQRTSIAEAIIALVSESDGPVTIAQIAERVGVSRPTFYKYFATLGSAMLHTHRGVIDEITASAEEHARDGADGLTRMLNRHRALHELAIAKPELIRFTSYFDYTFRRYGLSAPEAQELHALEVAQARLPVVAFIEAQADGSIREDLDPVATVAALGTSVLAVVQRRLISFDEGLPIEGADQIILDTLEAWRRYLKG